MSEKYRSCMSFCDHECIKINSFIFHTSPTSPPIISRPPNTDKGQQWWAQPLKCSRFLYECIKVQAYSLSVSVVRWIKLSHFTTTEMLAVNFSVRVEIWRKLESFLITSTRSAVDLLVGMLWGVGVS